MRTYCIPKSELLGRMITLFNFHKASWGLIGKEPLPGSLMLLLVQFSSFCLLDKDLSSSWTYCWQPPLVTGHMDDTREHLTTWQLDSSEWGSDKARGANMTKVTVFCKLSREVKSHHISLFIRSKWWDSVHTRVWISAGGDNWDPCKKVPIIDININVL